MSFWISFHEFNAQKAQGLTLILLWTVTLKNVRQRVYLCFWSRKKDEIKHIKKKQISFLYHRMCNC